jgi:hypothetical protein
MAQTTVSQATGRLVTASLLSSNVLDTLLTLKGAQAVNTTATGDVIVDTPLDASAVSGLIALKAGPLNLPVFGNTGIVQLGAVGQYGRANDDGSSTAFSGTVSAAPSLIGVGTVTAGPDIGSPTAGSSAELKLSTAALLGGPDLVDLSTSIGVLAASARESATGAQSGQYTLAGLGVTVGGTLVSVPVATLRPALDALITTLGLAGVTVTNPFTTAGTITLTLADLQAAGLGSDLNSLPPDTDLLSYVPQAVINKIAALTTGVLTAASNALPGLPATAQAAVQLALTLAQSLITPVLSGLSGALQGPLATAISAIAQLDVNHQSTVNGAFTETALRVGLGANGSLASVDLASASVGPNDGPSVVQPTTPPTDPNAPHTTPPAGAGAGAQSTLPRVAG